MAEATIPTPPQTPPCPASSSEPEPVPELSLQRLDSLLETYLELLDEHTTLRKQLSKQFSEGFFCLARANHLSGSLGNGRRYGEEGYDERMKAQRRIVYSMEVSRDGEDVDNTGSEDTVASQEAEKKHQVAAQPSYRVSIQKMKDARPDQTSTADSEQPNRVEGLQNSSTRDSAAAPASSSSPTQPKSSAEPQKNVKSPPSNRDPLNWYGILTPPPLRKAQDSFVSAVETSIPQLLGTSASMYDLECQITKLRTELRLQPGPQAVQHMEEDESYE